MGKKYSSPVITVQPESSIFDALLQMQRGFIYEIFGTTKPQCCPH